MLDEILRALTASSEASPFAPTRHLLDADAIGAMTTHDLSLAEEEPLKSTAQFMHFSETLVADGTMLRLHAEAGAGHVAERVAGDADGWD